jgi:hypothetical protein
MIIENSPPSFFTRRMRPSLALATMTKPHSFQMMHHVHRFASRRFPLG